MKRISLVPSAGISMPCYGYGDDRRLGRLFRETWRRLPLSHRRRLLKFWRVGAEWGHLHGGRAKLVAQPTPDGKQFVMVAPRVELLEFLPASAGLDAVGWCNCEGSAVIFLAPLVDALPDEAVMTLIAHELAHAYLRAIGVPFIHPDPSDPWDWEELQVMEVVDDYWGFDEEGLSEALKDCTHCVSE